ncbi:MAG: lysophospholipid acyltransferase family protein [Pyrinomonadaceae bacterium]
MRTVRSIIRFVCFVTATLSLHGLWWITSFFIPNKQYWRQLAFGYWTVSFVRIAHMKIEIIGTPPKPPFFLVSNHLSYVDIAALRAVVDGVFVAKKEIEDWFLAGRIVRDMGAIFIDRTNRRDIPRAGREIIKRLESGEGVIVFPEGTSTNGEAVLPFNSSFFEFAANADIPVSYVAVGYRTPDGELPASDAVCWWDDISFVAHMMRLFTVPEFTAVLHFGDEPVLNTDRKKLAHELRERVSECFVPVI